MPGPRVSVVTAVHDGARFLREAIDSVLAQTERSLELIVVDDGSTDDTPAVLASMHDERLTVVRLARCGGPYDAANRGLALARGDFIARLDADDVARPDRLERQAGWLDAHPSVGLLGSGCRRIDAEGRLLGQQAVPTNDLAIRLRALLAPPFVHSTVMWRRSLGLRYDESLRVAGDYELWARALPSLRAASLPEPLVDYRVWPGGITGTRRAEQLAAQDAISWRYIASEWPEVPLSAPAHRALRRWAARADPSEPMPPEAQPLVVALQQACLGLAPITEAAEAFHRAVHAGVGAWGQPVVGAS